MRFLRYAFHIVFALVELAIVMGILVATPAPTPLIGMAILILCYFGIIFYGSGMLLAQRVSLLETQKVFNWLQNQSNEEGLRAVEEHFNTEMSALNREGIIRLIYAATRGIGSLVCVFCIVNTLNTAIPRAL